MSRLKLVTKPFDLNKSLNTERNHFVSIEHGMPLNISWRLSLDEIEDLESDLLDIQIELRNYRLKNQNEVG